MKGRVIGCAAVWVAAGLAIGCPPGERQQAIIESPGGGQTLTGSFDVLLNGAPVIAAPGQGFRFVAEDEESLQVTIVNDEIKVVRNGKPVPPERVKRDGDKVKVLDENGQVVSEINLAISDEPWQWEKSVSVSIPPEEHPPVMLGITMGEPDESLRAHLGLGDRQVIMLDNVMSGLPAAEAGLKRYDIIIAIEGSDDGVSPSRLLEVLKGKQPGDELKLRVLRGGQKETYTIKLRPYDEAALNKGASGPEAGQIMELMPRLPEVPMPPVPKTPAMPSAPTTPSMPAMPSIDVEGILNKLRLQGLSDQQIDMVKKTLRQSLEQSRRVEIMRSPQGNMIIQGPDGQTRMIEVPSAWSDVLAPRMLREQAGGGAPLEERLGALERRLDEMSAKMDERLERMLRRMEQLTEQLERRVRDGG
ncbi:MAG: PDZ domain-containing protein [Phycisphaerales bacterium]|nr:PDZ domain-containing protein [Phycisphaerales bacterium]